MKINKRNLLHWMYLLWTGLLCFLLLPFRLFFKKKHQGNIILYGHKLHGNLNAIYEFANQGNRLSSKVGIYFLTLDPPYYYKIKHKKNILFALNPFDLGKVVCADCIISDHGLHSLILLLKYTNIHFADVWHGIPFKGFIPEDFAAQRKYDEVWVPSLLIKQLYRDKFGFEDSKVVVTGYGRTDLILKFREKSRNAKTTLGIPLDKKVILFAPTWKQGSSNRNEIPFGLTPESFISGLHDFAEANDAFLIVRFHLNTIQKRTQDTLHILHLPLSAFPNSELVVALSDVLITDWSSIAFDMMVLNNPILFLDVPPPFKNGLSLPAEFRCGDVVNTLSGLIESLFEACLFPERYKHRHQTNYQRVRELVYEETLDGQSTERYFQRINGLIKKEKPTLIFHDEEHGKTGS